MRNENQKAFNASYPFSNLVSVAASIATEVMIGFFGKFCV